jgi:hypothetical protein
MAVADRVGAAPTIARVPVIPDDLTPVDAFRVAWSIESAIGRSPRICLLRLRRAGTRPRDAASRAAATIDVVNGSPLSGVRPIGGVGLSSSATTLADLL